jgi:hypothetical protein
MRALRLPRGPFTDVITRTLPAMVRVGEGQPQEAAILYDQAAEIAGRAPMRSSLWAIHALQYGAEAHLLAGQLDEAEARSHEVVRRAGDPGMRYQVAVVRARRNLAVTALHKRQLDRAAEELRLARLTAEQLENPGEQAQVTLVEARLALAEDQHLLAAALATQAMGGFEGLGNPLGTQRALRVLRQASGVDATEPPGEALLIPAPEDAMTSLARSSETLDAGATELDVPIGEAETRLLPR